MLTEAVIAAQKNGECFYESELYRLKGVLLVDSSTDNQADQTFDRAQGSTQDEAEACFRQAIDIARHQSARSLELRAVLSLSRLLQKQGKKDEARKTLSEIYVLFTEGFETSDLKDAKALLEELS